MLSYDQRTLKTKSNLIQNILPANSLVRIHYKRLNLIGFALIFGAFFSVIALRSYSATPLMTYYISPLGSGDKSGSSWRNAGVLMDIPSFVAVAPAGAQILVRGDQGNYVHSGTIALSTNHAVAGLPITIRGVDGNGSASVRPLIIGSRTSPWQAGTTTGSEVFEFLAGANNLNFNNLGFENQGDGCFRFASDVNNITIVNMRAKNVRRFIDNYKSTALTASVTNLHVKDVEVHGYSKNAIRIQYASSNIVIEDFLGDSERQNGDHFAAGVQIAQDAHDVTFRRTTMKNTSQIGTPSSDRNGDGFATEHQNYNLQFIDSSASGNSDTGFDVKSKAVFRRTVSEDNKHNYRLWYGGQQLYDCVGRNPHKRGGSGSQDQIFITKDTLDPTLISNCTFTDSDPNTVVFEADSAGKAKIINATVTHDAASQFKIVTAGAKLDFVNLSLNGTYDHLNDPSLPVVRLTAPSSSTVLSGTASLLAATASSNSGISAVKFALDGGDVASRVAAPYTALINTTSISNGTHTITVTAVDTVGRSSFMTVSVTVQNQGSNVMDTTNPTATMTAPAKDSNVSGIILLSADASDDVGLSRVEFRVDNKVVSGDRVFPYTASYDTASLTNGKHSFTVRATDLSGNWHMSPSSYTIYVKN